MATLEKRELDTIIQCIPDYDPVATKEDCWFDYEAAQKALDFFPACLVHIKGALAGQPFHLEKWQKAVIANTFGWKRPNGTRRYREVFFFVPRKNGKTILAAGIGLYLFFCDNEDGAEIYCAANERDQARLLWDVAKNMIRREPELLSRCTIYQHSIVRDEIASFFKPISADAGTKDGFNGHGILIDELHKQKNSELVDVLVTSTGSRRQPLIVYLTTSDFERESICNQIQERAEKVRDGIIKDKAFLPVVYKADKDDDYTSPEIWRKANPNLGVSVFEDFIERECLKAQNSPSYRNTFKRLLLNIKTDAESVWLDMHKWKECSKTFNLKELEGQRCFAGLDLSTTTDLTALTFIFPDNQNAILSFAWIPKEKASQKEDDDRVPYKAWAEDGHLEITPGNVVDYDRVREHINQLGKIYNIQGIAIDRWNSTQLQIQLAGDGFDVIPFGQGFRSMSAPSKKLEELILTKKIKHNNNPLLFWCASNVTIEEDAAGNIKPSKKKSSQKIDPIVALIMAVGISLVHLEPQKSMYEDEGFFSV